MTVAELIKKLQKFNPELEVVVGPLGWGDPMFNIELTEDAYKNELLYLQSLWRD